MSAIREWHEVDRRVFEQSIVPAGVPAVLRSLVRHWPSCAAAAQSIAGLADYLKSMDGGQCAGTMLGMPDMRGHFFYDDAMHGFNFVQQDIPYVQVIDKLIDIANEPEPMAIYAGSVEATELVPGFAAANPMALLDATIPPRLWLGNASRVAAHYDIAQNIACVVSGQRRFTLFPPDQIGNLYIGPLDYTMAGQPASMVDFTAPDFVRYPKFRAALATAHVIELEPGDAIYIPALWWHHVEAFGPFNLLVNYWWPGPGDGPALESMVLGLLGVRDRSAPERAAWRSFFDYYVFGDDAVHAADHLPDHARSVLGAPNEARSRKMLDFVMARLSQR